jgi:hypothetical protein
VTTSFDVGSCPVTDQTTAKADTFRAKGRSVALRRQRVRSVQHRREESDMWVVGVGVFAVLAVVLVVAGVSKMRRASRGE